MSFRKEIETIAEEAAKDVENEAKQPLGFGKGKGKRKDVPISKPETKEINDLNQELIMTVRRVKLKQNDGLVRDALIKWRQYSVEISEVDRMEVTFLDDESVGLVEISCIDTSFTSEEEQIQTIQTLVDRGADINASDCTSKTVLQYAAELQRSSLISFLLELGANENCEVYWRKDNEGKPFVEDELNDRPCSYQMAP